MNAENLSTMVRDYAARLAGDPWQTVFATLAIVLGVAVGRWLGIRLRPWFAEGAVADNSLLPKAEN